MTVVVDASVAVKWFLADEADTADAFRLLRQEPSIIAPDIVIAEVCNAGWRSARVGRITPDELNKIAAMLPRFFQELVGAASLVARAVEIARAIDHPVYDCLYVALAETRGAVLITADARLLAKLNGTDWDATASGLARYLPQS